MYVLESDNLSIEALIEHHFFDVLEKNTYSILHLYCVALEYKIYFLLFPGIFFHSCQKPHKHLHLAKEVFLDLLKMLVKLFPR